MADQLSDLHRAKRGVAVLAACIVQTLNESDPTFQRRFLERLAQAYAEIKDDWPGPDVIQELELLSGTREFLTGFDRIEGQGEPFLHSYKPRQ
jgi:hypothetical protein